MRKLALLVLAACAAGLALWLAWPGPAPSDSFAGRGSREFLDGEGNRLAISRGTGQVFGPWLAPGEISPWAYKAAVAAEDQRFYSHPGVDPLALARATWQNFSAGRVVSGGSTITMQLARLLSPAPRSFWAKLKEAALALRLTARLSKREVLEQYLNRAPFGGPLRGLGAASRFLLGKDAALISPSEAALLLSLPKDPARLLKPSHRQRLKDRRDRILSTMAQNGDLTKSQLATAWATPISFAPPPPPPAAAPHFLRELAERLPAGRRGPVATYLNPGLQKSLAALATAAVAGGRSKGLRQAAILVLRNQDRAVLAWVGSADFNDPDAGQVDGVTAHRQPGSALKPFVYGLALENGQTLASLVEDEALTMPLASGTFRPVDYDGEHHGKVRLRVALASSLNLPALRLAREATPAALLARLRLAGFRLPLGPDFYGVGLALGDGEVSLLELAAAYAALADGGLHRPARLWKGQAPGEERQVFGPRVSRLLTDALSDDEARHLSFGRHGILELPFPAAVKTGTSQKHRDNWCVGFTSQYTVAVWVGNFAGSPMAGMSGISGAGPLWRAAMLLLHGREPGRLPPLPVGIESHAICAEDGRLADGKCRQRLKELFLAETLPPAGGTPDQPGEQTLPISVSILTPARGAVYIIDPDTPSALQVIQCQANLTGRADAVTWRIDGEILGGGRPLLRRWKLRPGAHRLEVEANGPGGRTTAAVKFRVLGG